MGVEDLQVEVPENSDNRVITHIVTLRLLQHHACAFLATATDPNNVVGCNPSDLDTVPQVISVDPDWTPSERERRGVKGKERKGILPHTNTAYTLMLMLTCVHAHTFMFTHSHARSFTHSHDTHTLSCAHAHTHTHTRRP
jgi:hypothetical protein